MPVQKSIIPDGVSNESERLVDQKKDSNMKRYRGKDMADRDLIRSAINNAAKHKKNRAEVKRVLADVEGHVDIIQRMILEESYKPTPNRVFEVIDGVSGKHRIVSCPKFFPDQVLHWLAVLSAQDIFMRGMYEFVCGSIPTRGIHYGRKYIKKWMETDRKNTKYCAKLDITKFYPSINHDALKAALRKRIKDRKLLWLFDTIIDSTESGLPIGNYTSQWLANFLLQDLDHKIKEEMHVAHYMRYMDDMVLFGANKKKLHANIREIARTIEPLGLTLKKNWQVFRVDYIDKSGKRRGRDIDFMGFRFFRDKVIMRKKISLRARRLAARIAIAPFVTFKQAAAMLSYMGWFKYSDSKRYCEKYIESKINIKKLKGVVRNENRKRNSPAEVHS
jgi:RNA-directed DNA polymerase